MYQAGGTVREALTNIEQNRYVLPAIQREYVWHPEQICHFFDSLMRGYPFGAFLFWRVDAAEAKNYRFYGFVRDYHERDNPHCPDLGPIVDREVIAVLDGQQRLTALNIGLRGSIAIKRPNAWRTNPLAYPTRHLYLNLRSGGDADEEGDKFQFAFRENDHTSDPEKELWFKVSAIHTLPKPKHRLEWLHTRGIQGQIQMDAFDVLEKLYNVTHVEKLIAVYEEQSQRIDRVLNIFIRLNSGGTVLSYSDLLLSTATSQWTNRDARKEVHGLVDDLNKTGAGFRLSKDFVLKAGLMLADIASVGFKVENFTNANMKILEEKWDRIRAALLVTVRLAASFGLSDQGRWAESSLHPLAYYLYQRQAPESFITHNSHDADRKQIRSWLITSLLKSSGIWGSGLDPLLTALRGIIQKDGSAAFPVDQLRTAMAQRGKPLAFTKEEVDELLELEYGDHRAFLLLTLLYPFVDLRNQFHVDHVFPGSRFTAARLRREGIAEDQLEAFRSCANRLANLQLLEGPINVEKQAKLPAAWLAETFPSPDARKHYCDKHDLGEVPAGISEFLVFHDARRERLRGRIASLFSVQLASPAAS